MLNRLFTQKIFGKVMAIICSFAILCPNAAFAATVTDWTELITDIAVTGATNTTTLTGNITADTTASLGTQGATALTIQSDDAETPRQITGDGTNTQGISVAAGQTLTLDNIILNGLKDYAVDNQGTLNIQGSGPAVYGDIIDSQTTKTGQTNIADGTFIDMRGHTISQAGLTNNGSLALNASELDIDNGITNNNAVYVNGGTSEVTRQTLSTNISGTGTTFFGPNSSANNYTEIGTGTTVSSATTQIYGLGSTYVSNVINNGTISGATDVRGGGVLTSNLSNLTGAINNSGTLNATGGTVASAITDTNSTGVLNVQGNVTNSGVAIAQNKINIENGQTLVTNASDLTISDKIYNAGTLQLTGGTNTTQVAGLTVATELVKGNVKIAGDTINNADMDLSFLQNSGAVTLTNNANIVTDNFLNVYTSGLQINGTGSIDVDTLTVGTGATLTQTGGITTHGGGSNYGTITGDMTLLYHNYANNELYQYGTINGDVTLDPTYNSYLFMKNGSTITGQIINNGGRVVATEGTGGTLDITGGITRTEEGRGNFLIGWNSNDTGTTNIKSTVEKQNITVGNNGSSTTLNVTHEDALIDDSSITINTGRTLNANASKVTNSTYLNDGTLNFTSGANANYIAQSNKGTVQISGNVSNSANIYQANLQVNEGCTFTNTDTGSISLSGNATNEGNLFGTGSIVNNGFIATHNGLNTTSTPTISGTGSLEVFDEFTVGTGKTITQSSINTHGLVWNYGTINSNVLLLGDDSFYHYGTVDGNVFLHESYEGDLFMRDNSSITGQITNNGGNLVATENAGTLNITGGITRTEEGRGNFYIGYNHFDHGTVNIQSTVEKQNIIVGYYNNDTLQNTLNVTHENALIDNSSIRVNAGQVLNANASKITNSTIQNNGNLNFNGGTNANAITGTGTLGISGEFVNNATINQTSLTLGEETNFTSYGDITLSNSADITNNGYFTLNGATLDVGTANIINNGTMSMDGSSYLTAGNLTNNAGHYLTIRNPNSLNLSGTFTNGGDVFLQGTLPEGFAITRTGYGTINVASGGTNSLTINNGVDLGNHSIVTYGATSLYVNADTFGNTITGSGDVYLRSSTFTGDIQIANSNLYFDSDDIVNFEGEDVGVYGTGNIYITEDTTLNVSGDSYITGVINNAGTINLSGEFGSVDEGHGITGSGVTNIPSGANAYIHNDVANTVNIAQTATLNVDSDSLTNITFGNTTINGTLGLTLTEITADSSAFTGTSLTASNLTLGENAALSLTVTNANALERGQQTGELSLINATYADDRDFATMFANNMYSVLPGTTLGKYIVAKLKTPEEIVEEAGGTKNNVETANAWDAVNKAELNAKAQDIYDELNDLAQHNEKGYVEKLNKVGPQGTQAVLAATQGLNNLIGANVAARVEQIGKGKAGGDFFKEGSVWLEALYSHANRSGDGEFSGNTYGANLGIDGKVSDETTLGFGYAFNNTKLDANTHDLTANGHTLFAYALYQPSQWYYRGFLNYGFAKYDDKNSTNSTDYNVQNIGAQFAAGYQIDEHWTPEAALRFTHLMTADYTDLLGQKVKNDDNDILTLVLGAKYETDIKTESGFNWTPKAHLNLTYDIVSDDGKATVVLADQTYQINSKKLDAFGIEAGVGAEMGISDTVSLNFSYDFTLKGKFTNHTGALKGVWHF